VNPADTEKQLKVEEQLEQLKSKLQKSSDKPKA